MALRAKIIVVLRTEIIVSSDSSDSADSGDSSDSVTILIFPARAGFVTDLARAL